MPAAPRTQIPRSARDDKKTGDDNVKGKLMVEELEKEYAVLKDKVRELREYL